MTDLQSAMTSRQGDGLPSRRTPRGYRGLPASTRAAFELLRHLKRGALTVRWTDDREFVFQGPEPGTAATLVIRDPGAPWRILTGGTMALGESYMDGWVDTPDLPGLLRLGADNFVTDRPKAIPHSPRGLLHRAEHALRRNTRTQARKNVSAHYDLGNDFYSLWLDPSLTYSSALYGGAACSLEEAQDNKRARLLGLLDPAPGSTILEIGCGWGAFAIQAARERGCRVTGITISREQCELARERVAQAGLADQVEIRLQDYRDVRERYDHVASIEMFEAVGEQYWPAFFGCVRDRLHTGGTAALQVITIPDWDWEGYRSQVDFTQKYIFPGGIVPSPGVFRTVAERAGLGVEQPFFFGGDYARTLATWLTRFDAAAEGVRDLGFDERFRRMWRYYLAWCNAGFSADYIDVMQVRLETTG
jgi:cyclopropane-fatty-acyl-phospholipid synthase